MRLSRHAFISAAVILFFAGPHLVGKPRPDDPSPLQQLKGKLKQLQDEVRALKRKIKSGSSKTAPPPPPLADEAAQTMQKAMGAFHRGVELQAKQLFRAAIEAYGEAVQLDPHNDTAFLRRGDCFYALGEYKSAEWEYTLSLGIQPDNSHALIKRATARMAMGQTKPALSDANEAILRDDKSSDSFLLRGRLNDLNGGVLSALADYTSALTLDPNSAKAYLARAASMLSNTGQIDNALADCDNAIRVNPNAPLAYLCRAEVFLRMHSPDRAVTEVNRALLTAEIIHQPLPVLNDLLKSVHTGLAQAPAPVAITAPVAADKPVERAEPAAVAVVMAAAPPPAALPPAPPTLAAQPPAVASPVSIPQAWQQAPPAPALAQGDAARYQQLGRGLLVAGNYVEAVAALSQAIELDPHFAKAFNARGYAHLRLKQLDLAISDFSEALRLDPAYSNACHNRSVARRLMGDWTGAAKDEREALQMGKVQIIHPVINAKR